MPFLGVSTVQFISEYRSVFMLFLSGIQLNHWLLWVQSKHAAIQQIWNQEGFLFNRQICCLRHVKTRCLFSVLWKVDFVACVGLRVKLGDSTRLSDEILIFLSSCKWTVFYVREDYLVWFASVSFQMDGNLFLEERERNQKHCGRSRELPLCSDIWMHSGLLWLLVEKGTIGSVRTHVRRIRRTNIERSLPSFLYWTASQMGQCCLYNKIKNRARYKCAECVNNGHGWIL